MPVVTQLLAWSLKQNVTELLSVLNKSFLSTEGEEDEARMMQQQVNTNTSVPITTAAGNSFLLLLLNLKTCAPCFKTGKNILFFSQVYDINADSEILTLCNFSGYRMYFFFLHSWFHSLGFWFLFVCIKLWLWWLFFKTLTLSGLMFWRSWFGRGSCSAPP